MAAIAPAPAAVDLSFPAERLGSIRRRTTWLLFVSQIFGSGGTTAALTVSSILAAEILGGSTWAGLPNSLRTLGAALVSVPLSAFMIRAGRRNGLLLGYGVGTIGAGLGIAAAVMRNYPLLLVGSAVFGAGYASNL
ncbi:MAG: MFS transporter, partial [Chloroflexota bacterium]